MCRHGDPVQGWPDGTSVSRHENNKTRSVFDRYHIVNGAELVRAAESLSDYFERENTRESGPISRHTYRNTVPTGSR